MEEEEEKKNNQIVKLSKTEALKFKYGHQVKFYNKDEIIIIIPNLVNTFTENAKGQSLHHAGT